MNILAVVVKVLGAIAALIGGYWLWDRLSGEAARREGRRIRKEGRGKDHAFAEMP